MEKSTDAEIKELILATVTDFVVDFLFYDRNNDDELPRGVIEGAIENGDVTVDEIIDCFSKELKEALKGD